MNEPQHDGAGRDSRPALGADLIIPLLGAGLTIYFLVSTSSMVWEARANGTVIGAALLVLVAVQVVKIARQWRSGNGTFGFGGLVERSPVQAQRLGLLVVAALFIAAIPFVGTTPGLFVSMLAGMWILGVRDWRMLLGISFAVAVTVYCLFILLLQSRLPVGPIETALGSLFGRGG
ncbi:MAG TPA: hypothetical protein VHL98_01265 [Microvirga sp.]|jgi:hypothetical protein|nr:hypothetical protein [Microvirga sp.]